jgi:hypothetical protein
MTLGRAALAHARARGVRTVVVQQAALEGRAAARGATLVTTGAAPEFPTGR